MNMALTVGPFTFPVKVVNKGLVRRALYIWMTFFLLSPCCLLSQVRTYPLSQGPDQSHAPATAPASIVPAFMLSGPISLDSLTNYVHSHSAFRFSFNTRRIAGGKQIYFARGYYSLQRLLHAIRQSTGLYYSLYKDHIIFQDNRPQGWIPENTPAPVPRAALPTGVTPITASVLRKPTPLIIRDSAIAKKDHRSLLYLQAGLFAAETFYANARLEAGLRPIHLIASYGIQGNKHAWQWGLGSILSSSEKRAWQVSASYTALKASFPNDSIVAIKPYNGKGWLTSFGLNYSGRLYRQWVYKLGASLNVLKTSYYIDGQLSSAYNESPFIPDPDKRFTLLQTPYHLVNTFKRTEPTHYKGWVGFNAGIYYNLPF